VNCQTTRRHISADKRPYVRRYRCESLKSRRESRHVHCNHFNSELFSCSLVVLSSFTENVETLEFKEQPAGSRNTRNVTKHCKKSRADLNSTLGLVEKRNAVSKLDGGPMQVECSELANLDVRESVHRDTIMKITNKMQPYRLTL